MTDWIHREKDFQWFLRIDFNDNKLHDIDSDLKKRAILK